MTTRYLTGTVQPGGTPTPPDAPPTTAPLVNVPVTVYEATSGNPRAVGSGRAGGAGLVIFVGVAKPPKPNDN